MAGKSKYSDDDRARAHLLLITNDGNVDRTVRESGIPRATLLGWKRKWEKEGPPDSVLEKANETADEFIDQAQGTRFEAIVLMRQKLPEASARDLAVIVGVLDDKITRAKGLATGRVEHVHTPSLPSPEELGLALGDYLQRTMAATRRREAIVGEAVEEPELVSLPAAETKE